MRERQVFIVSALAMLVLVYSSGNVSLAETPSAPFANDDAMREFSDELMTRLGNGELEQAQRKAVENSHLDDPVVQQNLDEAFAALAQKLTPVAALSADYIQTSKFGRSFVRHQFALDNEAFSMRCMMTYRRKTDGWRLNQLWCH